MRSRPAHVTSLDRLAPQADPDEGPPVHADRAETEVGEGWGVAGIPTWMSDRFGEEDPEDDPEPKDRRRVAVAPPAAIALILVGVVAVVIAGFSVLRADPEVTTPVAFPSSAGPTAPDTSIPGMVGARPSESTPDMELVVSVVGLVRRPGLVRLPSRSRVADAIDRAGGARQGADLLSLNLAQRLNDGDQILVGFAGDGRRSAMRSAVVGAGGASGNTESPSGAARSGAAVPGGTTTAGAQVNLNTATESQLDALPGVGPVTAKAIIAWRDQHGRFATVDQLGEVDGIGPARLARLRPLVTV